MVIEAAVGALASELLKAMTSEAGKDLYKRGKLILDSLRARFSANSNASTLIAKYEREPLRHDGELRSFLLEAARRDPDFHRIVVNAASQMMPSQSTIIGTQNTHNEIVHGTKTVNTITAGRDVIQGDAALNRRGE